MSEKLDPKTHSKFSSIAYPGSVWKTWGIEVISKANMTFQSWLTHLEQQNGIIEIFEHTNGIPKIRLKYIPSLDKEIQLLTRTPQMETLIIREAEKVIISYKNQFTKDFPEHYAGLIYFVYTKVDDQNSVLYIGICHRDGRDNNLNANLHLQNMEFFCRWGDDFARHIGGLSNALFHNGYPEETKYFRFVNTLFYTNNIPAKLKFPVYFQIFSVRPRESFNNQIFSIDELELYMIKRLNPIVNSIGFD